MSQFDNGVVLRSQPLAPAGGVIDTGSRVTKQHSDMISTLVMNTSEGRMGYETGIGFPTFTGMFSTRVAKNWFADEVEAPAKAYFTDAPRTPDDMNPDTLIAYYRKNFKDVDEMISRTGFDFSSATTGAEARDALALAYGQYRAEQSYSTAFENAYSPFVGMFSLGVEIVGDPTTLIGAGLGKVVFTSAAKQAVGKLTAKQLVAATGRVALENAVVNGVQSYSQSVLSQNRGYELWGLKPDSDVDLTAALAGGLFGAALPVSIAGITGGLSKGISLGVGYAARNLNNPTSVVNKVANLMGAPVVRKESISHLTTLTNAAADAELVAGTHKYLYNDVTGDKTLEIALTHDYWDEVSNTGITAADYARWGVEHKPSREEAATFLEGLMDEAVRLREEAANGGQSPAVAKAHKDLQSRVIKRGDAFIEMEDPEIANRGSAWALSNFKKSLIAGGATDVDATEQSYALLAMIAAKAASKDMGTDEWIARNIKNFTIDKNSKTGETLFSIERYDNSIQKSDYRDPRVVAHIEGVAKRLGDAVEELGEQHPRAYQDIRGNWRNARIALWEMISPGSAASGSFDAPLPDGYGSEDFVRDLQVITKRIAEAYKELEWRTAPLTVEDILGTLYQTNKAGTVQAAVTFSPLDGRAIIRAYSKATNFSSLVHELGHIFRRDLDPAQQAAADAWVGASPNTKWTVQQEEKFARGFEKWLRTRKATNSQMDGIFQKMKNWMTQIYTAIRGSQLDHVRLNDEIVNVFESMFIKGTGSSTPSLTGVRPGDGWKLHLNISEGDAAAVSAWLQARSIKHKIGRNDGQAGKGMTIYIGERDKANSIARELSQAFDSLLKNPEGEVLTDDIQIFGKIWGRFDIGSSDADFHQYGAKGIPFFLKDMDPYNRRDRTLAYDEALEALTKKYGTFFTGTAKGAVPRYGTGRIKVTIAGDTERALIALHTTKTKKDRYALIKFLRDSTGMTDNEILTASRFAWSELRSKLKEARKALRATNRPPEVKVDTNGSPYIKVELGDIKKIYDPEVLGSMKFRERFPELSGATQITMIRDQIAALRKEREALEYSNDTEAIAKNRAALNKANRKLEKKVNAFFPTGKGRIDGAEVVSDIDSGVVERTVGTKLDSTETSKVLLDGSRKGNLKGDWLVFNSSKAIKALRKFGNFFSTGHIETVGSDNPLVARLARLVSDGILYRDGFGPVQTSKGIGLEQNRHRVKALAGQTISEYEKILKGIDPALYPEIYKQAMAIASGATYSGSTDKLIVDTAQRLAAVAKSIYDRFGVEGLQNGYFRNTLDNYGGTFHILGTMRKPDELAQALFEVWKERFTKADAPIHRRTLRSIPSYDPAGYGTGGPKILSDLLPDDRDKYLKALLDESIRDGVYSTGLRREAQLVANNKLGFTELKELITNDTMGLVHSDPSLSRQINVDVWFDPRVSKFVDWDPYGSIDKYLEITGYRVKEQTTINAVVKELLGYDRRDIDAVGLIRGVRDLLLLDDTMAEADRVILTQSFQYLENQVNTLRSHISRDYSRQMGAMDTVANVTMNLGRTGVASRSAMAGLTTEIIPMLLATTIRHPKHLLPILKNTLGGLNKWQLKGLMAGFNHMFTHRPDALNHVANLESINHGWLDKTFVNPWRQVKASIKAPDATTSRIGQILTSTTSMLHRMSSGLGGEDFFQKMSTNIAALQTTYRLADSVEKMLKYADLVEKNPLPAGADRIKHYAELARKAGFGDDPNWAAKLNQAQLLDRAWLQDLDFINKQTGGRLLDDPNGAFNQNLIEEVIGKNADKARRLQAWNDRLLAFVENDTKTRVTVPGVQDSNIPAGGLDPITRMAQMFMAFQRSWFHNVLLNGISNSKAVYGLSFLGTMLVGELIYYHAYRMLYRGDKWEDIEEEWTENPTVMAAEAVARTNLFGSASAIGQHFVDIFSDRGGSASGSIYSLKVAANAFRSLTNMTKAGLSEEENIAPEDARRIEMFAGGVNAWWMRGIMQSTNYDSFSEWLFQDQPAN